MLLKLRVNRAAISFVITLKGGNPEITTRSDFGSDTPSE
jgi:hypothetical protein